MKKNYDLRCGDCRDVMDAMEPDSVDTIVTDPPYGLAFMGKDWDHGVPGVGFWTRALRVAKPGATLLAFGGTRTFHRLAVAIEDAGWEIRDTVMWVYGSGFPKSHNFGKRMNGHGAEWDGYGTALKPAWEPVIVAMKPRDGTFAENALKWGVAGMWIDGARVGTETAGWQGAGRNGNGATAGASRGGKNGGYNYADGEPRPVQGRWPANVIHDGSDEVLAGFPGKAGASAPVRGTEPSAASNGHITGKRDRVAGAYHADSGSAARFFYTAKASRSERNAGLEGMEERDLNWSSGTQSPGTFQSENTNRAATNFHPTVKPLALMRYLVRLTRTPSGGIVLDPFMGSGSTGCAAVLEGRDFIGIDQDAEYVEIARRRIEHWIKRRDPQIRLFGSE